MAQHHIEDASRMAPDILAVLPEGLAVLPPDEAQAVLSDLPRMT